MGPSTFDTGFEESGKFYVRNNILKFFILTLRKSNQGQVFKKRSEAVCLYAFILLLALLRNNDVDVIKLKKRSHQKQRYIFALSSINSVIIAPLFSSFISSDTFLLTSRIPYALSIGQLLISNLAISRFMISYTSLHSM